MKLKIVLIGSGQLGSRHLQALGKLEIPSSIYVIDNNTESLDLAKKRYLEINPDKKKQNISYHLDCNSIPEQIDYGIIATGSSSRFKVIENFIKPFRSKELNFGKSPFSKS